MNIGIIGAGAMGSALGKIWAQQGHSVMFSYSGSHMSGIQFEVSETS